jgi:hypothetical protein
MLSIGDADVIGRTTSPDEEWLHRRRRKTMQHTETEWILEPGRVRHLRPQRHGRWLALTHGRAWLTRSGGGAAREADVWLDDGARHWLPPGSDWVIEGWDRASFALLQAPPEASQAA